MVKWGEVNPGSDGAERIYIATFLPLKKWSYLIPFLRMSLRVEGQMKRSPGIIRYSLRTNLLKKHFWTLSVWTDRISMEEFVSGEPHATAVKHFERWAGGGAAFAEWKMAGGSKDWTIALEKLKNPTFYYQAGHR
jgi:hypothetical protein